MYLNIVFLPLIGSSFCGLFGRFLGSRGAGLISTSCVVSSLAISLLAFYEVGFCGSPCYIKLLTWFNSEYLCANWGFQFDSLTVIMLIVVTFISSLVHLYSTEYMSHDPHLPRFMSYLSLFTFFMLILVTADNFIQLFVGWEGVGLCSYLLINFWFTRIQANKAAIKAMIVNRIGDFGLALGIFTIYITFNSVEYSTVFALVPLFEEDVLVFLNFETFLLTLIGILLFIGAVGKSAQLGLHTWLPDAMEGPTPVSALIHAATMVTAGVFLLARCSPIFEYTPNALFVVTLIGSMTAFFAATTGLLQNDLKRVIAYSTCSQLGYMMFACGVSNYSVGVFHLANHAFFKALLFLSSGLLIAFYGDQDIRKYTKFGKLSPIISLFFILPNLSLCGFPFFSGGFSKELIIQNSKLNFLIDGNFVYNILLFSAGLTTFYSCKLLYILFYKKSSFSIRL
jgi:proton-translocating NADH-quinone oxidoreductase chain L